MLSFLGREVWFGLQSAPPHFSGLFPSVEFGDCYVDVLRQKVESRDLAFVLECPLHQRRTHWKHRIILLKGVNSLKRPLVCQYRLVHLVRR